MANQGKKTQGATPIGRVRPVASQARATSFERRIGVARKRDKRNTQVRNFTLGVGEIPPSSLASFMRVMARFAVEKALAELALDAGPTSWDNAGPTNKVAPPVLRTPTGPRRG